METCTEWQITVICHAYVFLLGSAVSRKDQKALFTQRSVCCLSLTDRLYQRPTLRTVCSNAPKLDRQIAFLHPVIIPRLVQTCLIEAAMIRMMCIHPGLSAIAVRLEKASSYGLGLLWISDTFRSTFVHCKGEMNKCVCFRCLLLLLVYYLLYLDFF